jgi:hypothetical protein
MLVEFVSKQYVLKEEKVEIELPILENIAYLHYRYSGGYNYFIKFIPSMYENNGNKFYVLDFIYMSDEKIIKGQLKISPFDFKPILNYIPKRNEFDYVGDKKDLPQSYLAVIANYWLLQKRIDDCFFTVITEERFNISKETFFNNKSIFGYER